MADTELFSLGTWIAFYSIALIAGVTQGAFGFGYPAIATPTLVLFTDVKTAIVVNMVPNLCVNFLSILRGGNYRASLLPHWPVAVYTLIASFLGALFLIVAPGEPLRLALALMVFAYLYSDRIRALDWSWLHRRPRTGQLVFGSIGGFFSGTVNLSMPPLLIYFMLLELAPTAMAQILNLCFFGGRLIQGVTLGIAGELPPGIMLYTLPTAVVAVGGLYFGGWVQDKIDARLWRKALRGVLLIMGCALTWQGASWIWQHWLR